MTQQKSARIKALWNVDRRIMKVTRGISYVAAFCMLLIAIIATANVIAAKIFSANYPSANDYVTYLFVIVIYCSLPNMHLERVLINVDILSNHFKKTLNVIIGVISDLLGIAVFALMSAGSFDVFVSYFEYKELSSIGARGAFQIWPFPLLMCVFCGIMALTFVWNLIRRSVYGGERRAPYALLKEAGVPEDQLPPAPKAQPKVEAQAAETH